MSDPQSPSLPSSSPSGRGIPLASRRRLGASRRSLLAGGLGAAAVSLAGTPFAAADGHPRTPARPGGGPPPGHGAAASRVRWEDGHVFPAFAEAGTVRIADVSDLDGFDRLLLISLQGLVNRKRPEIYLIADPVDATWVPDLPVDVEKVDDPFSLLRRYRKAIGGAIVYDMGAPDTINLATTLAGLRSGVVATAEQARRHGLEIIEDLRGRFEDDPAAIHAWAMEELWDQCTHRMLVGLPPVQTVSVEGITWTELLREEERITDSSNRGEHTVDLSGHLGGEAVYVRLSDSFPDDGWGPAVHHLEVTVDGESVLSVDANTAEEEAVLFDGSRSQTGPGKRYADGGSFFVYRLEVPGGATGMSITLDMENEFLVSVTQEAPTRVEPFASFRDMAVATNSLVTWLPPSGESGSRFEELLGLVDPGTVYAGWFSNDVSGEWSGVQLCSEQGVIVVAADYYMNASVLSGISAPTGAEPSPRERPEPGDLTYVTLTIGEGDNIQYCQRHMRELWDDPGRGTVPMNWTVSPLLEDVGPALLHHFQSTATENDLLVCGPSGAGYTYGDSWPQEDWDVFTELSGAYQGRTGLDVVYAYSTPVPGGAPPVLPEWVLESYAAHGDLRGIIQTDESGEISDPDAAVPLIGTFYPPGGVDVFREALLEKIAAEKVPGSPLFIAGLINAWNWTPSDVEELVESLPEGVEVVLADAFFDLFAGADRG